MDNLPPIAIIGPGVVGTALGTLAARAGVSIAAIGGRDISAARAAAGRIGEGVRGCGLTEAAGAGQLVLLTVSDDAIEEVCTHLAGAQALSPDAIVLHCSGALSSEVLGTADRMGCAVGSLHPLQTFPTVDAAVESLPGTTFFGEGEDRAVAAGRMLAKAIGCFFIRVDPEAKGLYHAAAVLACNYIPTLIYAALEAAGTAKIDSETFLKALAPLVKATAENATREGPAAALTGPIARGDIATVRKHLQALRGGLGEVETLYRAAGLCTVDLAMHKDTLSPNTAAELLKLLSRR